ncbi:hypothetical protein KOR42_54820 [Thalassoglobus neptunius]|uniref:Uncharacterized protein n=1 Tax=Thalassoglobus neptunius TaxID=1938619 RepID=A0A5C5UW15_9PLAN|nr:hypothetical protein [Thalassoglobus neptunius]TWT29813.1 hypothetical protein KOR42_54820 [Thalassoglobus neptunius]
MFWKRHLKEEQAFTQEFVFEDRTLRSQDGIWFCPLRDADGRWALTKPSGFSALGPTLIVIYHLKTGEFVEVRSSDCREVLLDGRTQWETGGELRIHQLDTVQAAFFLINHQFSVPPELQEVYDRHLAEQMAKRVPPPKRPPEFWLEWIPLGSCSHVLSHEVDIGEEIEELGASYVEFLQSLERPVQEYRSMSYVELLPLGRSLFRCYPVDPQLWRQHCDELPPEDLDLLELDWPAELVPLQEHLVRLRELIEAPLCCLTAAVRNKLDDLCPTLEEEMEAHDQLISQLPELKEIYTKVNQICRQLAAMRASEENECDEEEESPMSCSPAEREQGRNPKPVTPKTAVLANWGVGLDGTTGHWWLFRMYRHQWRQYSRVPIPQGFPTKLMLKLAEESGALLRRDALTSVSEGGRSISQKELLNRVTHALAKAKKAIREAIAIAGKVNYENVGNPIPHVSMGWRSIIEVGYVVTNDEGKVEFKRREEM